jgi:hypothetical protein
MSTAPSHAAAPRPTPPRARLRHTPGGVGLGKEAGAEGRRRAAIILEVLAGVRTPAEAAGALGVALPRYFQLEAGALEALVRSCDPKPRGPGRNLDRELATLQREHERLQRELSRQQTLVRLARRHLGLAPPQAPAPSPGGKGKKRPRRPVVRALRAAEALHQRSQDGGNPEAATVDTPPKQEQG